MDLNDFNPLNLFKQDTDSEQYKSGDRIFSQGDAAKYMYVVKDGSIAIVSGDTVLDTISAGGIFGEMALINPEPRSASAVASSDCEVVPVDGKRFTFMVQHTPFFAVYVMRVLADRLRATSGNVSAKD